jgi:hypothetical protein
VDAQLNAILEGLLSQTSDDMLLALAEGHLKVELANVMLELGYTLQEGTSASRYGGALKSPQADYLSLRDGQLVCKREDRRVAIDEGSVDLIAVHPRTILFELKTRPDFGTKAQAQFESIAADLSRVAATPSAVFVGVFDERVYRSFDGTKTESRGAPSKLTAAMNAFFPPAARLPAGAIWCGERDWEGVPFSLLCSKQNLSWAGPRSFVFACRRRATGAAG